VTWLPPAVTLLESHSGVVTGFSAPGAGDSPTPAADVHPRAVLESVLARAVPDGCVVQFSGGRDSSLVLAVATHVARQHGVPPPVAVAFRYLGDASSEEAQWQELVARHLGVQLQIVDVPPGAHDLAGPLGLARLERDGPVMPPPCGVGVGRMHDIAAGMTVLTGEGGDETVGGSRITPFVARRRRPHRLSRAEYVALARELQPRRARYRRFRKLWEDQAFLHWLTPAVRSDVLDALARDAASEPWDWRNARKRFLRRRMVVQGFATMDQVAEREGIRLLHPLIDKDFVDALCGYGGFWGLPSRTAAMRLLAGDLLPEAILARSTKAYFNNVYAGDHVRAFARGWDGSGVDTELVDVGRLKVAWLSDPVPAPSLAPLQLALLARAGATT
jgi:hypothetical protein